MAEAAWWSPFSLAVVDKKGHAHVLRLEMDDAAASLRFRLLLSTDVPIGRGTFGWMCVHNVRLRSPYLSPFVHISHDRPAGGSLACRGDDKGLLVLQSYVGLRGRLRGQLVKLERQTPEEAMLHLGRTGQVMEALEVAARFALDTDPMFKALWLEPEEGARRRRRHVAEDVRTVLAHVKDTAW